MKTPLRVWKEHREFREFAIYLESQNPEYKRHRRINRDNQWWIGFYLVVFWILMLAISLVFGLLLEEILI